jgi:two-component system, cell cycle response regulator
VAWFSPELEPMLAIAAAALDEDGTLIEANAGFLRLISEPGPQQVGIRIPRLFIQPDFATLLRGQADSDGQVHRGLLTLGDRLGRIRSLTGRVWRIKGQLRVLAEYDIGELEQLYDTVLALNRDYADAQLQLAQINLKLQQREAQIIAASLTDPLTGVGNRRRLEQALAMEISRVDRSGGSLSAFMADLDHFKNVNDTYGHEAGDKVLAAFGDVLRRRTRATDVVARFGGEEFVVLMSATDLEVAIGIAERIRTVLAASNIEPLPAPITASFGVAERAPGEPGDRMLRRVDVALYEAKRLGRNRVIAAA